MDAKKEKEEELNETWDKVQKAWHLFINTTPKEWFDEVKKYYNEKKISDSFNQVKSYIEHKGNEWLNTAGVFIKEKVKPIMLKLGYEKDTVDAYHSHFMNTLSQGFKKQIGQVVKFFSSSKVDGKAVEEFFKKQTKSLVNLANSIFGKDFVEKIDKVLANVIKEKTKKLGK